MTYKQIEIAREARLWIGQIIVPAAMAVGGILYFNPELRHKVVDKVKDTFKKEK